MGDSGYTVKAGALLPHSIEERSLGRSAKWLFNGKYDLLLHHLGIVKCVTA